MEHNLMISKELKRIRLAIFSFYFSQGLCFASWASRIPTIKNGLRLDDGAWGTILLMAPIGQICAMSISGLLVSKLGSQKILPFAFIGYIITLLCIGFSNTEYFLIMSLIAFGFAGNFCNISVNTQSVTIERQYGRPIMASFHGAWSLAGFVGASIGLLMTTLQIAPLYHFVSVGVLMMLSFFLNVKYLQADIRKEVDVTVTKKRTKPESFLYLLGITAFCGMAAEGCMSDWSGVYFQDIVGAPKHIVPLGLAAYMVTMASARFMVDRITVALGHRKVIQISGCLISIGLFLAVAFPNIIVTTIGFMIVGLGTSSIVPTVYSIAGHRTKISTSIALTIVSSVSFLGFLLGPPIIGYVSQATNLRYSYALIGGMGICIVILAGQIKVLKNE